MYPERKKDTIASLLAYKQRIEGTDMFYWAFMLTITITALIYALNPRTDSLMIDNLERAKAAVASFIAQHEAARTFFSRDQKPLFSTTVNCLDRYCTSVADNDDKPDSCSCSTINDETSCTWTCRAYAGRGEDGVLCREKVAEILPQTKCRNRSIYAQLMAGREVEQQPLRDANALFRIKDLNYNAGRVGFITLEAIKETVPIGFNDDLFNKDYSTEPLTADDGFASIVMCIANATGEEARDDENQPTCQVEYAEGQTDSTSDFLITYGAVPSFWQSRPEYYNLWIKAMLEMAGRSPECGEIVLVEDIQTNELTKYQDGTHYALRTPLGEQITLPCRFTRFLKEATPCDPQKQDCTSIESGDINQHYVACITPLFRAFNPDAEEVTDPTTGRRRRPYVPISSAICD